MIGYWHRRKVVLLIFSGFTAAALLAVMVLLDRPLKTEVAPRGIVSFELAGSYENAHRILASWGENGHRHAVLSLRLDYAFLVAYALVLYLLCAGVACSWPERCPYIRRMGFLLAGGQWVAALLDIIENILLQQILNGSTAAHLPLVARWCALVKFTLVAGGGLYIFWAGGMRVVCDWRSPHGRRDH